MTDIRNRANADAQRAFRRLLDHHFAHGEWHPALLADWHAAEATFDEVPEWMLDAHFDAVMSEMDELEEAEATSDGRVAYEMSGRCRTCQAFGHFDCAARRLPDVPLAAMTEAEARWAWGDR